MKRIIIPFITVLIAVAVVPSLGPAAEWKRIAPNGSKSPQSPPKKVVKPVVTADIKKKARILYKELAELRKDKQFLNNGFAPSSSDKSHQWNKKGLELEKQCYQELEDVPVQDRLPSELGNLCIAINYLNQIALQYALQEGKDDKTTKWMRQEVKTTLGVH
jgi:hypothetical protein